MRLTFQARQGDLIELSTVGDSYRHIAVQQERQPAEHGPLRYAMLSAELLADSMGEIVVIYHFSARG